MSRHLPRDVVTDHPHRPLPLLRGGGGTASVTPTRHSCGDGRTAGQPRPLPAPPLPSVNSGMSADPVLFRPVLSRHLMEAGQMTMRGRAVDGGRGRSALRPTARGTFAASAQCTYHNAKWYRHRTFRIPMTYTYR